MSKADLVIGAQWGDEGKGKIIDLISKDYDFVCRYAGGHNAGHTIVANNKKIALHILPSGVLRPHIKNVIGNGVVLNPDVLIKEIDELGIDLNNKLFISKRAHLNLDYHAQIDIAKEKIFNIGTTKKGIGPSYADKASRSGHRVVDLLDPKRLCESILNDFKSGIYEFYGIKAPNKDELLSKLEFYKKRLEPFISDTSELLWDALANDKKVLIEGAQGSMLDIDHGTYPFVTSSNTITAGALAGLGLNHKDIGKVIGVVKAYTTRVGNGAFPTELNDELGEKIAVNGNEFGTTTGRKRRCGYLDLVALKYAIRLNGIDELALMKIDVLDGFKEIKICTAYEEDNKKLCYPPIDLENVKPVYKTLDGFNDTFKKKSFDELDKNAIKFIKEIEEECGIKIKFISTSAKREDTIILK